MDKQLMMEIIHCLPKERTKFYYFRDRYALLLLSWLAGDGVRIGELKQHGFASLLQRPLVKQLLAQAGDGRLNSEQLNLLWTQDVQPFVLTVDFWGGGNRGWQQTTRNGYNLVLQLNFSNAHDAAYKRLVKPEAAGLLNYGGHPVLLPWKRSFFRETLAWARLDLDFDSNEVLIEEIQSDWVRYARRLLRDVQADEDLQLLWGLQGDRERVLRYLHSVLKPYMAIWDEAMLAATLHFVRNELGIERVYYHSSKSGAKLKQIYGAPPHDLYSKLPKRFCFRETREQPVFLQRDKQFRRLLKSEPVLSWYRLDLKEVQHHAQ